MNFGNTGDHYNVTITSFKCLVMKKKLIFTLHSEIPYSCCPYVVRQLRISRADNSFSQNTKTVDISERRAISSPNFKLAKCVRENTGVLKFEEKRSTQKTEKGKCE